MWNLINTKRGYNYLPHNVNKDAITTLKDYVTEKKGLFLHPCNEDTDEVLKFDDKGILRLVKVAPEDVVADDLAAEGNAADEGAVEGQNPTATDPAAKDKDRDDFSHKTHNLIVGTYEHISFDNRITSKYYFFLSPGTFRKAVELGKNAVFLPDYTIQKKKQQPCLTMSTSIARNS